MWSSLEGKFIGGRYSIVQHIATGGMAAVFRGWDHRDERPVAIKVLRQLDTADDQAIARFRREAYAAAALDHPHVVRVYNFLEDEGCYFLVMEFIDGVTLKHYLRQAGPLPPAEALDIAAQVCSALYAAHQRGFVHRDIKPQNVLLDKAHLAKLTDFGIVYVGRGGTLTSHGIVMGTADYIAPEQARGEPVTPASDLYSVGVVLYELLTGRLPFRASTPVAVAAQHANAPVIPPSRLVNTLSPYVDAIVLRAMRKCPEERYRDAMAMGLALRLAIDMCSSAEFPTTVEHDAAPAAPVAVTVAQAVGAADPTPAVASDHSPRTESQGAAKSDRVAASDHSPLTPPVAVLPPALADPDQFERERPTRIRIVHAPSTSPFGPGQDAAVIRVDAGQGAAWLRALVVCVVALLLVCGIVALEVWLRAHGLSGGSTTPPWR